MKTVNKSPLQSTYNLILDVVSVNAVMFIQWDLAQCSVNKSKQMDAREWNSSRLPAKLSIIHNQDLFYFFNKLTRLMIQMPVSIIKLNSVLKVTLWFMGICSGKNKNKIKAYWKVQ